MSTTENKVLARRMFEEVWNGVNLDAIDDLCSADIVVHFNGGDVNGATALKEEIRKNRANFPDLYFTVANVVAEGDNVALRCTYTATYQGTSDRFPASAIGKQFRVYGMTLLRFANGRCVEQWISSDRLGLLQQLGADPAKN